VTRWILILTIYAGGNSGAPFITSINFSNEKACRFAGETWLKSDRGYSAGFRNAICVPDSGLENQDGR